MNHSLSGKKIAMIVADGFEQVEMVEPKSFLEDCGAQVVIISPNKDTVKGVHHMEEGDEFNVDLNLNKAHAEAFDALVLPGGVFNPDQLRLDEQVLNFVSEMHQEQKPIAAICHGPWILINAGLVQGLKATSYHSIKQDMLNAGAIWQDESVVVDGGIITSRSPDDLEDFNQAIKQQLIDKP